MSRYGKKVNNLISDIVNGKSGADKELFDLTYNHLSAVARHYLVDKRDCEDVVSEAYIHAFRYINSFDGSKDGYNWLCRIVQNIAYTYNGRHSAYEGLEKADTAGNAGPSFEDDIISKSDIAAAMARLGEEDRQLVFMKFWQDMSYAEIAKATGLKKSYVHKKVSKAVNGMLKNVGSSAESKGTDGR